MPDSSGGHNGTSPIAIALCAVGGSTNTILLDLNGQTDPSSSDNHFNQQDCLFCLVVSQAMMPSQDAPALAGDIVPHSIQRPYRNQALPPLPALGPPLGSRAPPSNFG